MGHEVEDMGECMVHNGVKLCVYGSNGVMLGCSIQPVGVVVWVHGSIGAMLCVLGPTGSMLGYRIWFNMCDRAMGVCMVHAWFNHLV